jgi:prepilin-type N-terminal cleavage/methylation domain-containing protein
MRTPIPGKRSGFTLIELLVVIGIIGVLLALLFPAVQRIRETASRIRCENNLKEIGTGVLNYQTTNRCFPTNGGPAPGQVNSIWTAVGGPGWYWGLANPTAPTQDQTGSWAFSILPYIEQKNTFQSDAQGTGIALYMCPGRRRDASQVVPADDPVYPFVTFGNAGLNPWSTTDYAGNGYLLINRWPSGGVPVVGLPLTTDDVKDGLSNTILVGEKAMDTRSYNTGSWFWNEPVFSGGSGGTVRWGTLVFADGAGTPFAPNWGSAHYGVAMFVFGDNAVRPLRFGIEGDIMLALLTPAGGEAVSPDQ